MSEPSGPLQTPVRWRNWAGDQSCLPAEVARPASLPELCDAIAAASAHGRRVRVAGSGHSFSDIAVQTIAGAISTATHGTGARLPNISAQVVELTLVLADGSTLECSPERDAELWRAARVGLGALGVIAEVTLRCVPAFTLHGVDAPAPLAQTLERFDELALGNDH